MTDRELLKAAAKAAGIEIEPCSCSDSRFPFKLKGSGGHWSPMYDDGDALRLAVKLQMEISYTHEQHDVSVFIADYLNEITLVDIMQKCNDDPCAATRLAIVRAAAALMANVEVTDAARLYRAASGGPQG